MLIVATCVEYNNNNKNCMIIVVKPTTEKSWHGKTKMQARVAGGGRIIPEKQHFGSRLALRHPRKIECTPAYDV